MPIERITPAMPASVSTIALLKRNVIKNKMKHESTNEMNFSHPPSRAFKIVYIMPANMAIEMPRESTSGNSDLMRKSKAAVYKLSAITAMRPGRR